MDLMGYKRLEPGEFNKIQKLKKEKKLIELVKEIIYHNYELNHLAIK